MATASLFLALCPELRNLVYDFYFDHHLGAVAPPISRSPLALPFACRQLYTETHTLAFAATTFRARRWHLHELKLKIERVRPAHRLLIKRLELVIGISDFLIHPRSLEGLRFANAGLACLEELYVTFTGEPQAESRETYIRSNLEVVLWKTVAGCGNKRLRKICIVHGGSLRWTGIIELHDGMRKRLPLPWAPNEAWDARLNLLEGQFQLVQMQSGRDNQHTVSILLGHTGRDVSCRAERVTGG